MSIQTSAKTYNVAARLAGFLFILATATFIIGSGLIESTLEGSNYLADLYDNRAQVIMGVLLEYIDAFAVVGIGILFFPILKRYNETIALSYAGARLMEYILLIVSGIAYLALIELSRQYGDPSTQNAAYFDTIATILKEGADLAFQTAMLSLAIGSLPFCYLLYRIRLTPRPLAILGFIGYVALFISAILAIANTGDDLVSMLYIPGAFFEIAFPLWLIVKGVNQPSSVVQE